jgi:hypothetical protein
MICESRCSHNQPKENLQIDWPIEISCLNKYKWPDGIAANDIFQRKGLYRIRELCQLVNQPIEGIVEKIVVDVGGGTVRSFIPKQMNFIHGILSIWV